MSPSFIDRVERVTRPLAIAAGVFALALTIVGPKTPWGLLGLAPLAMGLSGW